MMVRFTAVLLAVFACSISSTTGLKCHEGINMTLNGIPMYFWQQRECTGSSACIGQEMSVDFDLGDGMILRNAMRYGACMSSAYASYLNCETLFGKDSKFNPAELLDMVPGIVVSINRTAERFAEDLSVSLNMLLSDGTGVESFVAGIFSFYENLGLKLGKARPLETPLANLLKAAINGASPQELNTLVAELFNAMGNLDTNDEEFSADLRQLLMKFGVNVALVVENNPFLRTVIDKIPGLVRSIFPTSWQADLWYDVPLKMVGDIDPMNWTKTAENLANRIKTSYNVPSDIQPYVYPFLNRLPDLAEQSQINPAYVGNWSLGLLQHFSEVDSFTAGFSSSLITFIERFSGGGLHYEFKATIRFLPGLFYKLFPGDKADVQKVYQTMADGFNSFKGNLSATAEPTPLSNMIINLIEKVGGAQIKQDIVGNPVYKALIINFSKMFTDSLNVKEDYAKYLTDFATVVDDEFKNYPNINVGNLITKLITTMGGEVPEELVPLLSNIQEVVTAVMAVPFDGRKLVDTMHRVVAAYKSAYPDSPFPELVDRYISLMYDTLTIDFGMTVESYRKATEKLNRLNMELQYWNIDLHFAIIKAYNFDNDELYKLLVKSFPSFEVYIRAMKAMNPEDVKQLLKDLVDWVGSAAARPLTTEGFVAATKPTFKKIAESIKKYMADIRYIFAPNTCKFGSCTTDLCNSQSYIASRSAYVKPTSAPRLFDGTSSAREMEKCNVVLTIFLVWIAGKFSI